MSRFQALLFTLCSLSLAGACAKDKDKDKDEKREAPSSAKTAGGEDLPQPFKGELTAKRITASSGVVQPFDPWTLGFAKLQAKMGKPTRVDGDTYYWAVMSDEQCTYTYVSKDNEAQFFKDKKNPQDIIGTVAKATTVGKELEGNWRQCIEAAGIEPEDLEDPNAPVPPDDGVTTIETFQEGLAGAKSKWIDKALTIEGVVRGVSTSKSGESETVILSIKSSADAEASLGCTLSDPDQGEGRKQGETVKVRGKANDHFKGGLSDCSVVEE